jgi:hypothetical protein
MGNGCTVGSDGFPDCPVMPRGDGTAPSTPVLALGVGSLHACAQTEDLTFTCWGDAASGQWGGPDGVPVERHMQGGYIHTCALSTVGQLHCWGESAPFRLYPAD